MSTSRIPSRGNRRKPRRLLDKPSGATCGEVTITKADGTVEIRPALTAAQLRRAAPDRLVITPAMRARVLGRDQATCRYCLTTGVRGPSAVPAERRSEQGRMHLGQ